MTDLRYRVVDVFSDRPLAGNALCVVLDECPERWMTSIAREVNLSETTFPRVATSPTPDGPGAYATRIFTPGTEMPFAGHPTIGTAWVLGPGAWTQTSTGAVVAVEADADGARMVSPPPALTEVDRGDVVAALGLDGAEGAWLALAGGLHTLIVATDAAIDGLHPDLPAVAQAAAAAAPGCANVAVVRRRSDTELHVRVFVPGFGIPEDPGTGSAAGPIATVAQQQWGTDKEITIRQGAEMGRPSTITVELGGDGPIVGGRVSAFATGRLTVPD
ncbi:MAG: PhzF family phenazine biosynthesis protein [Acidimicrobiales bacterium]